MKIVVLGGASFSTPSLFDGMRGEFSGCEFVLAARSAERLAAVCRAAHWVAGPSGPRIVPRVCDPASSGAALAGARVVIVQMRIGNLAGRAFDESFPLDYGLCGDEGLGAGGVSAAWRAWPQLEPWLAAVRRHAPNALVLMMSSPVGILTQAVHQVFPELDCQGICEVPHVALREIAARAGVDIGAVSFDYLGVNHLGWLYDVRIGERDWVTAYARAQSSHDFPSAELIGAWGGIPTKYLRLHFDADAIVAAQRAAAVPRAQALAALQSAALTDYAHAPSAADVRRALGTRDTPWYADAVRPLLRGLVAGQAHEPFFLTTRNQGHTPAVADDDVIEIASRVEDGRIVRQPSRNAAPAGIALLTAAFCRHEHAAAQGVIHRDESMIRDALDLHPWIRRAPQPMLASRLARVIVDLSTA